MPPYSQAKHTGTKTTQLMGAQVNGAKYGNRARRSMIRRRPVKPPPLIRRTDN
jgi:hypothetical protein